MVLGFTKEILSHNHCIKCFLLRKASALRRTALTSNIYDFVYNFRLRGSQESHGHCIQFVGSLQNFSTCNHCERLSWEGSSREILLRKLESSLKSHQVQEAWEYFHDFKSLYGFPVGCLVNQLVVQLSYTSNHVWLRKACDLALQIVKEKSNLLQADTLTKLALSLARLQMPVPASMILRLMLETECVPPMNLLSLIFLHMVKTEIGSHIASNYLVQISDCFSSLNDKSAHEAVLVKPNTMIFNLVLDACVRFKLSLKGQCVMDLMPMTGTVADAHSIVFISQILEMNSLRDEMMELRGHIDGVSTPYLPYYRQFYDSLLSLHFKFNDINAAAELVLGMNKQHQSHINRKDRKQKPFLVALGSHHLKHGLKIQFDPELLQKDSVLKVEGRQHLILYRDGKLVLSNRALAKFISRYKKDGKISELSKLLLSIQEDLCSLAGSSLCSDVIGACIQFGWLESAHDILDDMEAYGSRMGLETYISLLSAYYKRKMHREADVLIKQMKRAGLDENLSDDTINRLVLNAETSYSLGLSDLAVTLGQVLKDEEETISPAIYELNSCIYFFSKARMIEDMLKAYRRLKEKNIQSAVQSFAYMLFGYSSLGMYREITILWGDIKRFMSNGSLKPNRDLYELLLLNFLQGGYFERVMEVIGHMRDQNIYTDKWMYKSKFLRLHRNLYRSLKASDAKTEAQSKRFEYVQAFRKWVGID
ncbi:pentatricopeptide repeat-containing protein At4g17616-like [Neltuma alba]|uniref:pentatricopeptide repeat-containing protein At4g17616-like n=1 Tax=Neltuma alba TaxID=207710 RepID=UPI0010A3551A|nr:pentatricopeptide repeat-containing protein At4g17616-like [Prosopis alba]XP_028762523.1 pentatricopeptide repeat-containing protein At4g17616-like [Prosopis alba]